MDATKQEELLILVDKLKRKYKNNSKIRIEFAEPTQRECLVIDDEKFHDDVGYFYTYIVNGDFEKWIVKVIEKDSLVNPAKKYCLFIKPLVKKDNIVYAKLAKLLLEKKKIERSKRKPRTLPKPPKKGRV